MLQKPDDKGEIKKLIQLYGKPKTTDKVSANISCPFPPPWDEQRKGEVAFILQGKDSKIWLIRKDTYPTGIFRLPTGGITLNESVEDALNRELFEETGLQINPTEFLGVINYTFKTKENEAAYFSSYVFRYFPVETKINVNDKAEKISETIWMEPEKLRDLAYKIETENNYKNKLPFGERKDWCKFRAILHKAVYGWFFPIQNHHLL